MNKHTELSKKAVNQFESVWNHANGMVIVDAKTRTILDANPAAVRLFGGFKEKMIDKPCHEFFCPVLPCPAIAYKQEINRSERAFMKSNGEIIPIIKFITKIDYNGRTALLESFIDLSVVKEEAAEEERQRHIQMTEHFKQAKRNFLSQISHEMRTPMNAILGMMQIAKESEDIHELRYCLDKMSDSGLQLFELINEFFDMSEIDAGKFALENTSINIEKTLINVCNLMKEKIETKNIKFPIVLGKDMRMNYVGDERRLSQVISCVLSNAVKFTPENGKIRILVDEVQVEEHDSVLRFSVKDNGIGMTEEQLGRIWDTFEQAESDTSRKYGGLGIGLSIAKGIVEKMDGKIWARSKLDKGSTFYFEVKLRRPEQQDGPVIVRNIRPADIKVLVVDGDYESRELFVSIMNSFGMHIDEADTEERAVNLVRLAKAAGDPYDIIFSDYGSSEVDGIAVAKRINPLIDKNTFVVLVISSLKWRTVEKFAYSIGVRQFISKPLFPSLILDLINEIISSSVKQFDITSERTNILPDLSAITLLYAEDIEVNREVLISLLKETNIAIDCVENGKLALEKFRQNPDKYDMIITDIRMPEMDGHELTRAIRSSNFKKAKSIPIIALSAEVFREEIKKCFTSGMNEYIAKPININLICEKILQYKE